MKVRKKKKGAERGEGEASAIMVSQGALSCTLPDRRCFLGQGPASASRQGFTLVDTFKKKKYRDREGTGRARGSRGDLSCVLSAAWKTGRCTALCLLITGESDTPSILLPPLTLFFSSYLPPSLHAMCRASTRQRKELLYPLPPLLGFVGVLWFFFFFFSFSLSPEPMAPCPFPPSGMDACEVKIRTELTDWLSE